MRRPASEAPSMWMAKGASMFDLKRSAAVALLAAAVWPAGTEAQTWKEVTMSRQLEGTRPVRAQVSYDAGTRPEHTKDWLDQVSKVYLEALILH